MKSWKSFDLGKTSTETNHQTPSPTLEQEDISIYVQDQVDEMEAEECETVSDKQALFFHSLDLNIDSSYVIRKSGT